MLALHFEDETTGFVVGASNLVLRTEDGGRSWQPWMDRLPTVADTHLYAITRGGGALLIAGEQGTILRSTDDGGRFAALPSPYGGSFFAAAAQPSGEAVIAGLRGNAYSSTDGGGRWTKVELGTPVSIGAAVPLAGGDFLLVDQAGRMFRGRGDAWREVPPPSPPPPATAAAVALPDGRVVGVGPRGVWRATLPAAVQQRELP